MKAVGWAIVALALAGLGAPAEAADWRYYGPDPGRIAYDEGYRDGLDKGEKDGRDGHRYEPWRHGDYRDADDGYHREFGPKHAYQRVYRSGFEEGYRRAFDRYGYRGYGYYGRDSHYGSDGYARERSSRGRYRYDPYR